MHPGVQKACLSRRDALKAMAAGALLGTTAPASAAGLSIGKLPDGRRRYALNRITPGELLDWGDGVLDPSYSASPFRLRLARIVDEPAGEPVPEWPVTAAVVPPNMGWESVLAEAEERWGIAPDQIVVTPEARTPVFYSSTPQLSRWLQCPRCGLETALTTACYSKIVDFRWEGCRAYGTCPGCWTRGELRPLEFDVGWSSQFSRWNPTEIDVIVDGLCGTPRYVWRIPEYCRRNVRQGNLFFLQHMPLGMIEAIRDGKDFMFAEGCIMHVA